MVGSSSKEELITALGLALIVLGALGAFALADLLIGSALPGEVELSILGVSLGEWRLDDAVALVAALAAGTVACLLIGIWALRSGRRSRQEERRVLNARLDSSRRLLEWQVEMLLGRVRELEEREAAIEAELEHASVTQVPQEDQRVVVVPDLPPAEGEGEPPGGEAGAGIDHREAEPADPS